MSLRSAASFPEMHGDGDDGNTLAHRYRILQTAADKAAKIDGTELFKLRAATLEAVFSIAWKRPHANCRTFLFASQPTPGPTGSGKFLHHRSNRQILQRQIADWQDCAANGDPQRTLDIHHSGAQKAVR